jgi:hypothetical protein
VLIRAEPARTIVAVRDTVASFMEARMIIGELARILPQRVPRETLGPIIGIAHSAEFEPDAIDVELGFILNGERPGDLPSIGRRQLRARELPAVPHMAACVRVGLPEDAHLITGKIGCFVETHGYGSRDPAAKCSCDRHVPIAWKRRWSRCSFRWNVNRRLPSRVPSYCEVDPHTSFGNVLA